MTSRKVHRHVDLRAGAMGQRRRRTRLQSMNALRHSIRAQYAKLR